jgi:hypothetical protein
MEEAAEEAEDDVVSYVVSLLSVASKMTSVARQKAIE